MHHSPFSHLYHDRYKDRAPQQTPRDLMAEAEQIAEGLKQRIVRDGPGGEYRYQPDRTYPGDYAACAALINAFGRHARIIQPITATELARGIPQMDLTLYWALEHEYGERLRTILSGMRRLEGLRQTFGMDVADRTDLRSVHGNRLPLLTVAKTLFTLFGLAMIDDAASFDLYAPLGRLMAHAVPLGKPIRNYDAWITLVG